MIYKILLLLGLIAVPFYSQSQETCASNSNIPYEWPGHNNWFFAPNAYSGSVMNMSTGVVTSVGDAWNPVSSYEGVSAASDDNGDLLFYTNGRKLWKGTGAGVTKTYGGLLEGNENGIANGSAAQGVITVRHPLNANIYYIFTTDDALAPTKGLNYFTFDSNGNHLSGPIRLGNFRTTEGISATSHDNGVDVWVTVLESGTGNFNTYLVECTGVASTPIVSSVGSAVTGNRERGGISFSWDGNYFASAHANWWPSNNKILSIYQFNKETGVIHDAKNVSSSGWGSPYDVTFSPDNQRVYVSLQNKDIKYVDISSWNEGIIRSTWASTGISVGYSAMSIGANGSMYISHGIAGGGYLKKVNGNLNSGNSFSSSNVTGTAGQSHLGLPTMYIPPAEEPDIDEVGSYCDTDPVVDLSTNWICSGIDAENAIENPLAYTGNGITNRAIGIFDPALAGVGIHEIIFTYCNVNDTIWIDVTSCASCASELQNITPEICFGDTYMLDTLITSQSAVGVWTMDSFQPDNSPIIITGTDTFFDGSSLNVAEGTYKLSFIVTDGSSTCYDSLYILVKPALETSLGNDTSICINDPALVFDAGIHTSYSWQPNGETGQTISASTTGKYVVTVIDYNGCTAKDSIRLTVNDLPKPELGVDREICNGFSGITFDAGAYSSYLWQPNGETSQTINTNINGNYILSVIDENQCTANDTVNLAVNDLPIIDLGLDTAFCDGNTFKIDAGSTVGAVYLWQPNAELTQVIEVVSSGIYSVEVTDSIGCSWKDTLNVTVHENPILDLGPDLKVCPTLYSAFTVGEGWTSVLWNEGATTASISVGTAGTYYADVATVNGCISSDTVVFGFFNGAAVDLGTDQTICSGTSATFNVGLFESYKWQDSSTLSNYFGSNEEAVYVTVVDTNGCVGSDTSAVFVSAALLVDLGEDISVCVENSVTINSGYLATAAFNWNTGATSEKITVTTSGIYGVEVTDTNGCKGSDSIEVTINTNPIVNLGGDKVICEGDSTVFDAGSIWQSIKWNDLTTNQILNVKNSGTYFVQVVDATGCISTDTVVVVVGENPIVSLGDDAVVCPGKNVTFKTTPNNFSSYLWQNGSISSTYQTLNPEIISVIATDMNGCKAKDTVVLRNLPSLNVELPDDQLFCEGNSYTIIVPDYDSLKHDYIWSTGSTKPTITVTTTATYNVFISNEGGCAGFDTIRVVFTPNPKPLLKDTGVCVGEIATFNAGSFASYNWLPNRETTQNIIGSTSGVYSVTVTDTNNCIGSKSANLTLFSKPVIPLYSNKEACEGQNILLNPNLPLETYLWRPTGEISPSITVSTPGDYTVRVTNKDGCLDSLTINARFNSNPIIDLGANKGICKGNKTDIGQVNGINVITWNTGVVSDVLETGTAGDYIATITDLKGCFGKDTISVSVYDNPIVKVTSDTLVCMETIGSFTLQISAGNRAQFIWSTGEVGNEISITTEDSYYVTTTNINGCSVDDTINIGRKCLSILYVANAFTPNGDGSNDYFGPIGLNISEFDFYVFDRWGEEVFHSSNINNQWDGTYNGNNVQVDVYVWKVFYKVEEDGGWKSRTEVGTVTLLR